MQQACSTPAGAASETRTDSTAVTLQCACVHFGYAPPGPSFPRPESIIQFILLPPPHPCLSYLSSIRHLLLPIGSALTLGQVVRHDTAGRPGTKERREAHAIVIRYSPLLHELSIGRSGNSLPGPSRLFPSGSVINHPIETYLRRQQAN